MRVRFWGTRGSIAKAGPGTVRYGGNTSCVELRSPDGTLVVLDCGTGAHGLGSALLTGGNAPRRGHILITHTHWDHIQGFPFFAPLRVRGNEWDVYGPHGAGLSLRETLAGQMQYTYFPLALDDLGATVRYHDLVEGRFKLGDIQVTAQYLHHPALTIGYRLECAGVVVVYATDHEPHSRRLAVGDAVPRGREDARHEQFLAGADLVIHDAQYTADEYPSKVGWGHSTMEYVVQAAAAADVQRLALFHHDPLRDDDAVENVVSLARERVAKANAPLEVLAAAEGQVLDIERTRRVRSAYRPATKSAIVTPASNTHEQSVLVAVSEPATADLLADAAADEGLRLFSAADVETAIEVVHREKPTLLIIERSLAGRDGLDLCREVRGGEGTYAKEVAIVVIQDDDDPEALLAAGATGSLARPFDAGYARARMRSWLLSTDWHGERAPLGDNEAQRVRAVRATGLLDSEPEERFDRYTRIAAALFEVPVVLITLVDADRLWFKSHYGTDTCESPRDVAFCPHAILDDTVMQVPDALLDTRFADNPFVVGEPFLRFYAGAPLKLADGSRAGTLCLVDYRPRSLSDAQVELLCDLRGLVEREFRSG